MAAFLLVDGPLLPLQHHARKVGLLDVEPTKLTGRPIIIEVVLSQFDLLLRFGRGHAHRLWPRARVRHVQVLVEVVAERAPGACLWRSNDLIELCVRCNDFSYLHLTFIIFEQNVARFGVFRNFIAQDVLKVLGFSLALNYIPCALATRSNRDKMERKRQSIGP